MTSNWANGDLTWYMYITTNLSYTRFKPFVKKTPNCGVTNSCFFFTFQCQKMYVCVCVSSAIDQNILIFYTVVVYLMFTNLDIVTNSNCTS